MNSSRRIYAACAFALSVFATSSQAVVVFDNISAFEAAAPGAGGTGTSSSPNTFMGDAYTLAAGTTQITGIDLLPFYAGTSTVIYNGLKVNFYIWGTVNTGTVSAATPAFSNLLGSYSVTYTGSFQSGFYYSLESASPGVTPGISLTTPLTVTGPSVGITVNTQGSTDGGLTFATVQNLTSVITYGVPATVGANVFNGYYRNSAGETNGNFTTAVKSLGLTNQSVAVRLYGTVSAVPEPATYAMMGLGVAALLMVRRRKA
jgi:hypothetical protein